MEKYTYPSLPYISMDFKPSKSMKACNKCEWSLPSFYLCWHVQFLTLVLIKTISKASATERRETRFTWFTNKSDIHRWKGRMLFPTCQKRITMPREKNANLSNNSNITHFTKRQPQICEEMDKSVHYFPRNSPFRRKEKKRRHFKTIRRAKKPFEQWNRILLF